MSEMQDQVTQQKNSPEVPYNPMSASGESSRRSVDDILSQGQDDFIKTSQALEKILSGEIGDLTEFLQGEGAQSGETPSPQGEAEASRQTPYESRNKFLPEEKPELPEGESQAVGTETAPKESPPSDETFLGEGSNIDAFIKEITGEAQEEQAEERIDLRRLDDREYIKEIASKNPELALELTELRESLKNVGQNLTRDIIGAVMAENLIKQQLGHVTGNQADNQTGQSGAPVDQFTSSASRPAQAQSSGESMTYDHVVRQADDYLKRIENEIGEIDKRIAQLSTGSFEEQKGQQAPSVGKQEGEKGDEGQTERATSGDIWQTVFGSTQDENATEGEKPERKFISASSQPDVADKLDRYIRRMSALEQLRARREALKEISQRIKEVSEQAKMAQTLETWQQNLLAQQMQNRAMEMQKATEEGIARMTEELNKIGEKYAERLHIPKEVEPVLINATVEQLRRGHYSPEAVRAELAQATSKEQIDSILRQFAREAQRAYTDVLKSMYKAGVVKLRGSQSNQPQVTAPAISPPASGRPESGGEKTSGSGGNTSVRDRARAVEQILGDATKTFVEEWERVQGYMNDLPRALSEQLRRQR